MSITFNPYHKRADGAWVLSYADPDGNPNFNNQNATDVLEALGFEPEEMWDADLVPINLFEAAIALERSYLDGKASPEIEPRILPSPGLRVIDGGRFAGYMNRRLDELQAMVTAGRACGATHIGWG